MTASDEPTRMISRVWHGYTAPGQADAYEALLREEIFTGIEGREIEGFREIQLFRRDLGDEVEFITVMWFDSWEAVRTFAGEDYEASVVPPAARAVLSRFDERSQHYEVRERRARAGPGAGSAASLPLSGDGILARSSVQGRLPAQDLDRARRFYAEKLGLEPVEEREGGLRYRCGSSLFSLFASAGEPSGTHTQMAWKVDDIEATVAELRGRGLEFEEYDFPGFETRDGIVDIPGTYPSEGGVGERAVWFRDSEGNLLGIGQPLP